METSRVQTGLRRLELVLFNESETNNSEGWMYGISLDGLECCYWSSVTILPAATYYNLCRIIGKSLHLTHQCPILVASVF